MSMNLDKKFLIFQPHVSISDFFNAEEELSVKSGNLTGSEIQLIQLVKGERKRSQSSGFYFRVHTISFQKLDEI